MVKKYLRGFSNLGYTGVIEDSADKYATAGEVTKLPGAKTCSPTDNKTDFEIPADDGVYDSGTDWTSTTLEIAIAEMSLKDIAALTGADFSEMDEELEEGTFDNAPSRALTYSALRADGGYRLYRYYSCKATNYKVTHTTKGQSTDSQDYTITFKCIPRKFNGKIRGTKDIAKGESLAWLDTIPSLPEITGG